MEMWALSVGAHGRAPLQDIEMSDISRKQRRRSIRLPGYDYSQPGMYFVTICVEGKACLFGEVVKGEMAVNEYGRIVQEEWSRSAEIRREIQLDEFVVMPNHVHGIVEIIEPPSVGATGRSPLRLKPGPPPRSLGSFVAGFKSAVTTRINILRGTPDVPLWQRNYYEHIIRNEDDLRRIREYIQTNPVRWELDRENPAKRGEDEFDRWLDSLSTKKGQVKK
jgi:REP element-mobilizing transposase RayT